MDRTKACTQNESFLRSQLSLELYFQSLKFADVVDYVL